MSMTKFKGMKTSDGAGVKLYRILGTPTIDHADPFLLLDEFKSDDSADYIAGFPDHPHRGFETITYMKNGSFRHKDSTGGEGLLVDGGIQRMTAGRGIIHSELPEMTSGQLWGYQLWINLPSKLKMIEPSYQDVQAEDLPVHSEDGFSVKILSGTYKNKKSPVKNHYDFEYFDVELMENKTFKHNVPIENQILVYCYSGKIKINEEFLEVGEALSLKQDIPFAVQALQEDSGFLFLSAKPIGESIARHGPFVMNTEQEIQQAISDYQNGKLA